MLVDKEKKVPEKSGELPVSRMCIFRSHLRAHVHAPVEHATHTRITLAVACTNTTYAVFCNVVVPKAYTK
jgi:hypothetical protein